MQISGFNPSKDFDEVSLECSPENCTLNKLDGWFWCKYFVIHILKDQEKLHIFHLYKTMPKFSRIFLANFWDNTFLIAKTKLTWTEMAVQSLISIFLQSLHWTRDGKYLIDGIWATSIILHITTAHDRHYLSITHSGCLSLDSWLWKHSQSILEQ